jgi:hypothetical protein
MGGMDGDTAEILFRDEREQGYESGGVYSPMTTTKVHIKIRNDRFSISYAL